MKTKYNQYYKRDYTKHRYYNPITRAIHNFNGQYDAIVTPEYESTIVSSVQVSELPLRLRPGSPDYADLQYHGKLR